MRALLFFGLSVALLCALVFADHHKDKGKKTGHKDDHEKKDDHQHHHGHHHHGHHHGPHDHHHDHHHKPHHHSHKSFPCHKLAASNSKFAFDLYKQVAADRPLENIAISPVSISIALAFLSLGARANTHNQILEGIGFNTSEITKEEIHEGFHHLLELLTDDDSELHIDSGNGLFISKAWKILDEFLNNAKEFYDTEAFSADFQNSEEAKKQINSYIAKQTHDKITEAVSDVNKDAALILVNYIYFRGQWKNPFDEKFTKEGDFHVSKDEIVKVPFMSKTGNFEAAFLDEATLVALPYKGNASALFILPNEGKLKEVETNLKDVIKKWKKSKSWDLLDLRIPKFSISGSVDLKQILPKFGIAELFSNSADLSGITGAPDLKISAALHKSEITVDEKGTEAAATTVMEAIPMRLPTPVSFNRPLMVSVYNYNANSLLFTGRIVNPAK